MENVIFVCRHLCCNWTKCTLYGEKALTQYEMYEKHRSASHNFPLYQREGQKRRRGFFFLFFFFHCKTCPQTKTHPEILWPRAFKTTQTILSQPALSSPLTCHLVIYDIVWPLGRVNLSTYLSNAPRKVKLTHCNPNARVWLPGKTVEASAIAACGYW